MKAPGFAYFAARCVLSRRGAALVLVLLLTALMATVLIEIVFTVHVHTASAGSYKDGQRAAMLVEGGVELASANIARIIREKPYTYYRPEDASVVIPEGDGVLSLNAEDEQAKFNLNTVVYPNGETNQEAFDAYARLLGALELKPELADTLADWIDPNDTARNAGAETNDYYMKLKSPYAAKNARLDSVDELLLVKGYSPDVYRKIAPYVTVYTDGKVNINTAAKQVIMALSDAITGDMADRVIEYRGKTPFQDTAEVRRVPGFETVGFGLQGRITVKSAVVRVFSRGTVGETRREAEAVVDLRVGPKTLYWRQR